MPLSSQINTVESGNDPYAQNPNSSAYGPGQFINSTWLSLIHQYRPDLEQGQSQQQVLGLRSSVPLSKEMTDDYAAQNQQYLANKGLPVTPGTTYLGHFLGPQGAASILKADPSAAASGILGDSVIAANPFLGNMTAGDVAKWADGKMQAAPLPPATNVGSLPATPQQMPQAAPIAGPAPQQQQPQPQQPQQQQPMSPMMQQLMQQLMQPAQAMQLMQAQPYQPRLNMAQAYQKIPLPSGFTGFQS